MGPYEESEPLMIMSNDEDRMFGTENINPIWGEWKIYFMEY